MSCRICFDSTENPENNLISPCKCIGTVQFIHKNCLFQWVRYTSNTYFRLHCDICKTKYHLPSRWHIQEKLPRNYLYYFLANPIFVSFFLQLKFYLIDTTIPFKYHFQILLFLYLLIYYSYLIFNIKKNQEVRRYTYYILNYRNGPSFCTHISLTIIFYICSFANTLVFGHSCIFICSILLRIHENIIDVMNDDAQKLFL